MSLYTNNVPQAVQTIAETQPLIQDNFAYLASSIGVDHNFLSNSATASDGYHKVVHFVNQLGDPAPVAGVTQLYTKTSNTITELFERDSTGTVIQMTGRNIPSKYAWSNGLLFQWGFLSLTAPDPDDYTINFNVAFPVACLTVCPTLSVSSSTPNTKSSLYIYTISTTQCVVYFDGSSAVDGIYWLAVGY